MNDLILEVAPAFGAELRAELIAAHVLTPRTCRVPGSRPGLLAIDATAIEAVSLELCAVHGPDVATQIADDWQTDPRVAEGVRALLRLAPGELKNRSQRPRARAKREWQSLGLE